jgi:hypothetical protein
MYDNVLAQRHRLSIGGGWARLLIDRLLEEYHVAPPMAEHWRYVRDWGQPLTKPSATIKTTCVS